ESRVQGCLFHAGEYPRSRGATAHRGGVRDAGGQTLPRILRERETKFCPGPARCDGRRSLVRGRAGEIQRGTFPFRAFGFPFRSQKPMNSKLAFTCGDPAGVGPEVVAMWLKGNAEAARDVAL